MLEKWGSLHQTRQEVDRMPLYDYECLSCHHEFEDVRRIDERHSVRCPRCGGGCKIIFKSVREPRFFPEGWWEHIDVEPVYISSRRQLREVIKKKSEDPFKACYAVYDDGYAGY